jgi:hypothetical protein
MADSEPDLQLVISTGDLPWNDHPGDWWSFFDKGRPIFNRWLFLPAVGNHDTPGVGSSRDHQSFLHYFAVPTDSPEVAHYQFQASNVRFYAMNSERPDEFQPKGAQYQWLEQRLTDRSSRRQGSPCAWRMAYWHIPPFNAGRRHYRSQFQFRPLLQLFAERIDWQFSGHEHMYQRFEPIRPVGFRHQLNDQYGRRRDGGVGYAIIPSGGVYPEGRFIDYSVNPALRAALAFPRLAASENFYQSAIGFLRVEVDGARFRLNSLQVDASGQVGLIDAVDYRRSDCEVDWLWGWP